jgi:hypothetical protein
LTNELNEVNKKRRRITQNFKNIREDGWEATDKKINHYGLIKMNRDVSGMLFKMRSTAGQPVNPCSIFLVFLSPQFIYNIITSLDQNFPHWNRISSSQKAEKSLKAIYQMLAVKIRIQGLQNCPSENRNNDRPLRYAVKDAKEHSKAKGFHIQSSDRVERLIYFFLLTFECFDDFSYNFQSIVSELGEYVEKKREGRPEREAFYSFTRGIFKLIY